MHTHTHIYIHTHSHSHTPTHACTHTHQPPTHTHIHQQVQADFDKNALTYIRETGILSESIIRAVVKLIQITATDATQVAEGLSLLDSLVRRALRSKGSVGMGVGEMGGVGGGVRGVGGMGGGIGQGVGRGGGLGLGARPSPESNIRVTDTKVSNYIGHINL